MRTQVALLTLACPARRFYGRAFPAFFGRDYLAALEQLLATPDGQRLWTNAVRRSDYIGSWVGRPPGTDVSEVPLGKVDAWCDDPATPRSHGPPDRADPPPLELVARPPGRPAGQESRDPRR